MSDKKEFNYTDRQQAIINELAEGLSFNEANECEVKDFGGIVRNHYPEGVTDDLLESIADLTADVSLAVTAAVGRGITDKAIACPEIGQLEWRGHTPIMDFGVSYVRPTVKKPTRRHYEASTSIYTGVRKHDLELDVKEALADLWD